MNNEQTLRRVNKVLTIVVVTLGLYITILPFWPQITLSIRTFFDDSDGYVYRSEIATNAGVAEENLVEPPDGEQLVIPSIQLDEEVLVGDNPQLMHQGVWHRPNTSTPDKGGNSVFVGHRFSYNDPAVFYHLDRMKVGEQFAVFWEGKEYNYEVFDTLVVDPSQISIEGKSDVPILTLYTCTPLWTATNRLVVRAKLLNPEVLETEETTTL